jgi:hypothetical protein
MLRHVRWDTLQILSCQLVFNYSRLSSYGHYVHVSMQCVGLRASLCLHTCNIFVNIALLVPLQPLNSNTGPQGWWGKCSTTPSMSHSQNAHNIGPWCPAVRGDAVDLGRVVDISGRSGIYRRFKHDGPSGYHDRLVAAAQGVLNEPALMTWADVKN